MLMGTIISEGLCARIGNYCLSREDISCDRAVPISSLKKKKIKYYFLSPDS